MASRNAGTRARQSRKLAGAASAMCQRNSRLFSPTITRRSGSAKGSGRSNTALTVEKIAVFAPMTNASVATAVTVSAALRRNERAAKRRSAVMLFEPPRASRVAMRLLELLRSTEGDQCAAAALHSATCRGRCSVGSRAQCGARSPRRDHARDGAARAGPRARIAVG